MIFQKHPFDRRELRTDCPFGVIVNGKNGLGRIASPHTETHVAPSQKWREAVAPDKGTQLLQPTFHCSSGRDTRRNAPLQRGLRKERVKSISY